MKRGHDNEKLVSRILTYEGGEMMDLLETEPGLLEPSKPISESKFQTKVLHWIKQSGVWYFRVAGGPYQRSGVADILVCSKGQLYCLELKAKKGRISELQKHDAEFAVQNGAEFWIFRSLEHEQVFAARWNDDKCYTGELPKVMEEILGVKSDG